MEMEFWRLLPKVGNYRHFPITVAIFGVVAIGIHYHKLEPEWLHPCQFVSIRWSTTIIVTGENDWPMQLPQELVYPTTIFNCNIKKS